MEITESRMPAHNFSYPQTWQQWFWCIPPYSIVLGALTVKRLFSGNASIQFHPIKITRNNTQDAIVR